MKPCKICERQDWEYSKDGNRMIAKCRSCDNVVSWQVIAIPQGYEKCLSCNGYTKVVPVKPNRKRATQACYYTHQIACKQCNKRYNVDDFKVTNQVTV